jgi:hypothetical protein
MPIVGAAPADLTAQATSCRAEPRRWRWHGSVAVLALALAVWIVHGLWADPAHRVIADNVGDQAFFEWVLGYGTYALGHGTDPFFTGLLNAPLGVNLAVNTSITVYAALFWPVTVLAGPQVSFVLILTLNLACAAFAWYLFLARYVVRHLGAAALAGMFAGFAPGFISHANGHLNWTAGWVAPLLLWWVLKLREPGRWLRNGLVLGLLVTVGFSIAAEGLFFTALACAVFLGTWSLSRSTIAEARAALPTVAAALAVTAAVVGTLLAYPMYMHFAGPQSFSGTGHDQRLFTESIVSYLGYSARSLAGGAGLHTNVAPNPTEETSFFGPPLLILIAVAMPMLWRWATPGHRATLRAVAVTGVVFALLSFGPRLRIFKDQSEIPMPYAALMHAPLFDSALPARFALVVVGVFAVMLALTADRLLSTPPRSRAARIGWTTGFAVALVPLIPIPLLSAQRTPEPTFIADGTWKAYVPANGVLTTLPVPATSAADGQRWQAYTMARGGKQFRIPGGYFLGPGGPDGRGRIGAIPRRTALLFDKAAKLGQVPLVGVSDRQQARTDFAAWGVDVAILPDAINGINGPMHRDAVLATATALLGPPERVADVDLWRIIAGTDPIDHPTGTGA